MAIVEDIAIVEEEMSALEEFVTPKIVIKMSINTEYSVSSQ